MESVGFAFLGPKMPVGAAAVEEQAHGKNRKLASLGENATFRRGPLGQSGRNFAD